MAGPANKTQAFGGTYEVARPGGTCGACGEALGAEQRFMAALLDTTEGFRRFDCCHGCWPRFDRVRVLAFWQAVMPRPEQKRRLFVDDTVLCELFERLGEVSEPAKVSFRFVLGLILMRKRLVICESTRTEASNEIWSVRMRGRQDLLDLVNPRLDEAQIREVSQQLGEILQQEL